MKHIKAIGLLLLVTIILGMSGCVEESAPAQDQRTAMADTQKTPVVTHSNERANFLAYMEQVSDQHNIQFIYCFNMMGQVVIESPVMGKTVSATKSTDPSERFPISYYQGSNEESERAIRALAGFREGTPQLMNPSGMYGHDTPGVIWQDPEGRFHEWHDGPYYISDYPIAISTPVLSFRNIDNEMSQKVQKMEARLKSGGNLTQEEKDYLMSGAGKQVS